MKLNEFGQKTLALFSRVDTVKISHLMLEDIAGGVVKEWAFSFPSVENGFVVYHMTSFARHMGKDVLFVPDKRNLFHVKTSGGEKFYTL
jgi:hypothetical protein